MLSDLTYGDLCEMAMLEPQYGELLRRMDISLYTTGSHPGAALRYKGQLLAVGGIIICEGVGQTWLVVSDYARKHPRATGIGVKRFLEQSLVFHNFHRLEANVNIFDPTSAAFVEAYGFTNEGTRRCFYRDGTDAILYGWISKEMEWAQEAGLR